MGNFFLTGAYKNVKDSYNRLGNYTLSKKYEYLQLEIRSKVKDINWDN